MDNGVLRLRHMVIKTEVLCGRKVFFGLFFDIVFVFMERPS